MLSNFRENMDRLTRNEREGRTSVSSISVLLAVSGGIDSMCMAHLFSKVYPGAFSIATVNFNLRGEESDADELLVKNWAKENGVRCFSKSFDTISFANERGISTQMAARELRYSWFNSLIEEHGFDFLATAHNLNDSVETLFINMVRGTGIQGMTGIKERNGKVIRPLLIFERKEIVDYVKRNEVPFREDKTNAQSHYSRNRIRNMVFPELKKINPSFFATVERSISNVQAAVDIIEELFNEKRDKFIDKEGGKISVNELIKEKRPDFWLYMLLNEYGFNFSQVKQIAASLQSQPGKEFHSDNYLLVKDREWLLLYPKKHIADKNEITLDRMTLGSSRTIVVGDLKICFSLYPRREGFQYGKRRINNKVNGMESISFIDYDLLSFPLIIRQWRPGDRFMPLGMAGFKKISDFLIDLKLDKVSKSCVSVVVSSDEIVALPGYRIDNRFRITSSTVNILEISVS